MYLYSYAFLDIFKEIGSKNYENAQKDCQNQNSTIQTYFNQVKSAHNFHLLNAVSEPIGESYEKWTRYQSR